MNASLRWLEAFLGRELEPRDAAERLTLQGAAVDAIEPLHQDLGGIVIGLVEHAERHPNADRLSLCRVNDGRAVVEVVCGAPNVQAGKKYPYAPVGTTLPGGVTLTARKIRGATSNGMLCSARELGLGTDHEGILELDVDAPPGARLIDFLPLADHRLVLDVGANRPDLLGHKGIARELGAAYGAPLRLPGLPGARAEGSRPRRVGTTGTVAGVSVTIDDAEGCPRFVAAVVRGVRVRPSPLWLQTRLWSVGARPINNVVDVTNYIMYELNRPLHAFDLHRLRGGRIVVRRAQPGETMRTLDGVERKLDAGMTMICDGEGPVGIGGVMGGAESEVGSQTVDVLLECAAFDPKRIRSTRKALGLTTEASYRFERGIDVPGMEAAVRRTVGLLIAVAGGAEGEAPVDVYPRPSEERLVFVRPERVAQVLGVAVPQAEIERHLVSVGFAVAPKEGRLAVQVPGWRPDVTREVDLIEEVARLKGYGAFPSELVSTRPSTVPEEPTEKLKAAVRRALTGLGLHEARTLSLGPRVGDDPPAVSNPLSSEEVYLRGALLPGLVRCVERNWAARERDIRLFELGVVFQRASSAGALPNETLRVAGVITGARTPPHWTASGKAPDYDAWDVKAIFETVTRIAAAPGPIMPSGASWTVTDQSGRRRGWAGEASADRPKWAGAVYGFEVDLVLQEKRLRYAPLPVTPPLAEDLALVLPPGVTAAQVEGVIREAAGPLLESLQVFDEYRDPGLAGRSVAWHLVFRAPDRTLRDEEAKEGVTRVLGLLKERLGVERR